jgi:hypothetical protein
MLDRRMSDRVGGLAAIATAGLFAAGLVVWSSPGLPEFDSPADVGGWLVHHRATCRAAAILASVSLVPMLVFGACLFGLLRDAEGDDGPVSRVYLGAILGPIAFDLLFLQFLYRVAWRGGETAPQATHALSRLFVAPGAAAFACWTLAFAAIALVVWRHGGLPRWLGLAAILVAAVQLVLIPVSLLHSGAFQAAGSLFGVFVPLGAPLIWGVAAGVVMVKRSLEPEPIALPLGLIRLGERTVG